MIPALIIAAVAAFIAWVIFEVRRDIRDQRAIRQMPSLYLAEEIRRALHPDTYAGPTHADPSRDSRGRGGNLDHHNRSNAA